jgi:hypothetical protein
VSGVAEEARIVALRPRRSPSVLLSRCGATLGPHASTVKSQEWRDEGRFCLKLPNDIAGEDLLEMTSPAETLRCQRGRIFPAGPGAIGTRDAVLEPPEAGDGQRPSA